MFKVADLSPRALCLPLMLACATSACRSTAAFGLPRLIIVVLIDAQRADHLGCYGSPRGLTPALDALATTSFVFEQAVAASAWTRSSVASLFTGRHAAAHGVLGRMDALPPEALTLAEVLAERGWETLAVSTNGNAGHFFGFAQGFE